MDLQYSQEYEDFREEVKTFLAESWPLQGDDAQLPLGEQGSLFRDRAIARGYLARSIPRQYGGSEQDADVLKATIIGEEFARVRAPGELRGLFWYAAYAWDDLPDECERAAAHAKAHLCDRFMAIARDAVELHGGIGFTWECDVQFWFKRAMFDRTFLGGPAVHRERAAALGGW